MTGCSWCGSDRITLYGVEVCPAPHLDVAINEHVGCGLRRTTVLYTYHSECIVEDGRDMERKFREAQDAKTPEQKARELKLAEEIIAEIKAEEAARK